MRLRDDRRKTGSEVLVADKGGGPGGAAGPILTVAMSSLTQTGDPVEESEGSKGGSSPAGVETHAHQ